MKFTGLFSALVIAASVGAVAPAPAQTQAERPKKTYRNPIIDRIGPADPHVIRHEGKNYLYPTLDGKSYDVFVSDDLVHWEQKPKCFTDPRGGAWAPDVFHQAKGDGKFYLYYLMYSGSGADGPDYGIGYATAKSPLGPFTKHPGNPIAHRGNGVFGPGHHCVVTGPEGKLWMVYHQQNSEKVGWDRFLAIDPLWFDEQGVLHVETTRGTGEPAP